MDISQLLIHHAAEHLREPVVDSSKKTEEGSATHHKVEVSYDEVRVVHLDVQRSIT